MERLDDLLADGGEGLRALLVAPGLLDRLQAEQHRRQLLPGLVVQLPRQPAPLELLCLDDPTQRVAGDTRGEVDRDSGARSEGLGQAQVGIGEAWVGAIPVVGDDHADRPPAGDEGDVEAAAGAEPAGRFLVDLGIVEERVDPLARRRSSTRPLFDPARSSCKPTISPAPSPSAASIRSVPSCAGSAIVTRRAPIRPRRRRAISSSRRGELDLARERRPDLVQRLELLRPGRRRLVQARVLDRHRRLARQRPDELLVLLSERLLTPSRSGRDSRRRRPRSRIGTPRKPRIGGWLGGKADRARVVADRLQAAAGARR